jgi:hypothetical protein
MPSRLFPKTLTSDFRQCPRHTRRLVQSDSPDLSSSDIRHILTVRDFVCWVRGFLPASVAPNNSDPWSIGKSVFGNVSKQPTKQANNCSAVSRCLIHWLFLHTTESLSGRGGILHPSLAKCPSWRERYRVRKSRKHGACAAFHFCSTNTRQTSPNSAELPLAVPT